MDQAEETIWCNGCGAEITWGGFAIDNHIYCCKDCFNGLPCKCGERMDIDSDRRSGTSSPEPIGD